MDGTSHIEDTAARLIENIERVVIGKRAAVELLVVALLGRGHVLIEDVPGTGKTMLARALAISAGVEFHRVQCTPDLLPGDITGSSVFNPKTLDFEFRRGPVFTGVLLADEINRATPRTQSALLEAMQERQVTSDGVSYPLPDPFLVLATQNPIEYEGTFPLPEAQLDRFLLRVTLGYPSEADEMALLDRVSDIHPINEIGPVTDLASIMRAVEEVAKVHVSEAVRSYIIRIARATRTDGAVELGLSPRGAISLHRAAQALAAVQGRDYVKPDHIKRVAQPVIGHRLVLNSDARLRGTTAADIVGRIVDTVPVDPD